MSATPDLQIERLPLRATGFDGLACVDLEDWHQICLMHYGRGPRHCREQFRRGLQVLTGLLDKHGQKATFFALGMTVAEDPGCVRELAEAGHEIATHGYGHIHLERLTREQFRDDLQRALAELAELTDGPVLGHRAPEFSIPRDDPAGFFSVVAEAGLRYDSSVFPIAGGRYGLPDMPREPFRVGIGDSSLIEFPLATVSMFGRRKPIAGGGYWRLLPRWLLKRRIARARLQCGLLTLYVHNYEFDPRPLKLSDVAEPAELEGAWRKMQFRQNLFRSSMSGKLDAVLSGFRFTCCRDFLSAQDWAVDYKPDRSVAPGR